MINTCNKTSHLIKYRFKKGNSFGAGRPKGSKNLATHLKALLDLEIETESPIFGNIQITPIQEVVAARLIRKALDGDNKAIREIFDRLEGRPKQRQEITGDVKIKQFLNDAMSKAVKGK